VEPAVVQVIVKVTVVAPLLIVGVGGVKLQPLALGANDTSLAGLEATVIVIELLAVLIDKAPLAG